MNQDTFIKRFLHAELSEKEMQEFHQQLKDDQDFAEAYKIHKLMHQHRLKEFRKSIASPETVKPITNNNSTPIFNILRNIAAIFILAAISYISFNSLNKSNDPKLLVDIFLSEQFMSPGTLQSAEGDEDTWQKAIILYSKNEFEQVEAEILKINNPNAEQQLYLGLSKLYKTNPNIKETISLLESIKDRPDNFHQDATDWYLALAYFKNGQHESAKPIIKLIAEGDHFKSLEAIKLLKHIEKL